MCKTDNQWEVTVWHREASLALCDIWRGGEEAAREGGVIYTVMTNCH